MLYQKIMLEMLQVGVMKGAVVETPLFVFRMLLQLYMHKPYGKTECNFFLMFSMIHIGFVHNQIVELMDVSL